MRFCRFSYRGKISWGVLENEKVQPLAGPPYYGIVKEGEPLLLADVELIAPVEPSKIICLGLNYADHAREMGAALPEEPVLFMKPPSSIIGPREAIVVPNVSQRVDYEAELAVVMGKKAYKISSEKALEFVFGYTCANDVTARDLQQKDGQWTRSKSFDTFCPMGPWIETEINPHGLNIKLRQNGVIRQQSNTENLIFKVPEIISYISYIMTLLPGDVILTGTPAGVGPVKSGDFLEVEIEGIGTLENTVK